MRMEWDKEVGYNVEYTIPTDELAYHLHESICFAEGTTLRDLLMLIARDSNLFTMLTACDCLPEILGEIETESTSIKEMVALEFSWSAQVEPLGTTTVIESTIDFYGLGDEGPMALEFMSAARMADLPILLNEAFNIYDGSDPDKMIFSTTRRFNLISVVCGVIGELTFLGSPKERDEALADLHDRVATVDDGEFHTIEEIRAEWDRRSEEDRKRFPCRICSEDNRCACFGKPVDICHDCFTGMKEN